MSQPQDDTARASVISSLYIQALRQGEALWFRVVSGSMNPTLHIGDVVRIEPTMANAVRVGEIAAFETPKGLIIHRIVQRESIGTNARFLEMGEVDLRASWVETPAVVGRAVAVCHSTHQIDLQHPIAKRWGKVTANLRYRLYRIHNSKRFSSLRVLSRRCSRLAVHICYWRIRSSKALSVCEPLPVD